MPVETQCWDEASFCDIYEATWEISVNEVHYGWLAPGEKKLGLLSDIPKTGANVLDVGCGMAQNLIALAKEGITGYGLDISSCMLDKAHKLVSENDFDKRITLEQGDMRTFTGFDNFEFDLVLSIYSMEYLAGVQELRSVVYNLFKRLKPGGVFILCFSHPSQAHRYPELMNCSIPLGGGKYRTYNYSFKDATDALFKAGFTIDRMIEQETRNPSSIPYEKGKSYPYHFREGCNLECPRFH